MKKMNPGISLLLALVVLAGVLVGCGTTGTPAATSPSTTAPATTTAPKPTTTTQTITDFQGLSVTIPAPNKIERVAILTSPPNIITFVLGVNDKMCATSNAIKSSVFLNNLYPRLKDIPAVRASASSTSAADV